MIRIDDIGSFWLSYGYLKMNGIQEKTIGNWKQRNLGRYDYINNRAYVLYDSIPAPTRKKLPSKDILIEEAKKYIFNEREEYYLSELQRVYFGENVRKWRIEIEKIVEEVRIKPERLEQFARRAAVFEHILKIYHGKRGELDYLHKAYLAVFPNSYSMKNRFCMALKQVRENGVLSVAIDRKCFRNVEPEYKEEHRYYAAAILNHNKAYSITYSYDLFKQTCADLNLKLPTYKWFRVFYGNNKYLIDENRYGVSVYGDKSRNYAKIIPALHAGSQWQMDGWRIPVFCKKYDKNNHVQYFTTYYLFAILDSHSRKIIGYHISESENTETILTGLERAVINTGFLPYEIVADNHSFNQTSEAENLKKQMEAYNVHWTVDSNPRRKSLVERAFRTLGDKHFKTMYGYIGQGVKTKMDNGRTQQELMDVYTKPDNFLTYEQVVAVTVQVVEEYNNTAIEKLKDSPNHLYEKSEKPNAYPINDFNRVSLFNRKAEYKVLHGQITIKRSGYTYEYQLPAKYSLEWNNKQVSVRYADFEEIYLFDPKTDKPICSVVQKFAIHGALADQTEKDIELLNKNKGRIKGIETQRRKKKEKLFEDANAINPDAYEYVNKITASKDTLQVIENNANMQKTLLVQFGINHKNIAPFPTVNENLDRSMRPKETVNRHPFSTGDGTMEKIIIEN